MENLIYILIGTAAVGLAYSFWKSAWVKSQETGNLRMQTFSKHIAQGVSAFLKAEYKVLMVFGLAVAVLLFFAGQSSADSNGFVAVSYVVGAVLAAFSAFLAMRITARAQVRTLAAAQNSSKEAVRIAFSAAAVSGIGTVSLGILGLSALFLIYNALGFVGSVEEVLNVIAGFAFGASTVSLFARIGGGIFLDSASVASEIGANIENGIPKNSVLNPAYMSKNSGNILTKSGGTASDLLESLAASVVAAMVIGASWLNADSVKESFALGPVVLPLALAASGILISMLATFFVKINEGGTVRKAIYRSEIASAAAMLAVSYFVINALLPQEWIWPFADKYDYYANGVWSSAVFGVIAGLLISTMSGFYSSVNEKFFGETKSKFATKLISGFRYGMKSTVIPVFIVAVTAIGAYYFAGLYGMAIAAVGMLANTGFRLSSDTFVAVVENANAISEMSKLGTETTERAQALKNASEVASNSGRGFAATAAAISALALMAAFMQKTGVGFSDFSSLPNIVGISIGTLIPLLFSFFIFGAVNRVAQQVVAEVQRQYTTVEQFVAALAIFKKYNGTHSSLTNDEITALHDAESKIDNTKCSKVNAFTTTVQTAIIGIAAIALTLLAGYLGGAEFLNGLLLSVISVSLLISVFQVNTIENNLISKIFSHLSINTIVKFIAITALLIASSLASESDFEEKNAIGKTIENKNNSQTREICSKTTVFKSTFSN